MILPFGLTPTERKVLVMVMNGKTDAEAAAVLGSKRRTVSFHVSNVLEKMGASNRAHATSIFLMALYRQDPRGFMLIAADRSRLEADIKYVCEQPEFRKNEMWKVIEDGIPK